MIWVKVPHYRITNGDHIGDVWERCGRWKWQVNEDGRSIGWGTEDDEAEARYCVGAVMPDACTHRPEAVCIRCCCTACMTLPCECAGADGETT